MVESMAGEWLGFDEVSARTGIPSTSLRRWARQFRRHLGSKVIGRAEKFPLESLKTFGQIAEMFSRRMSRMQVQAALERILEVRTLDVDQVEDQVRQVAPGGAELVQVLGRIAGALEGLVANQEKTLEMLTRLAVEDRRKVVRTSTRPEDRTRIAAQVVELRRGGMSWRMIRERLAETGIERHERTLRKIWRRANG